MKFVSLGGRALILTALLCTLCSWVSYAHGQTDVQQLMNQPGVLLVSDRTNRTGASGVDPLYNSHGSTIVQTSNGNLLMAYYEGGYEGADNQSIYVSTRAAGSTTWSPQQLVVGNPSASFTSQSTPVIAMYNPVLFQPAGGPLFLYYKQGTEASWLGYYVTSTNNGQTWSTPTELPTAVAAYDNSSPSFPLDNVVLGPIRSKPVQLSNGTILFGQSIENDSAAIFGSYILSSTSATNPFGAGNWSTSTNIDSSDKSIQPTFIYHSGGTVEALTRMYSGNAGTYIGESLSTNYGATWSNVVKTPIPNNWSAIEGLGLSDGRDLLFCNPDNVTSAGNGRNLLVALVSTDGVQWHAGLQLENVAASTNDEFDYPAAIQTTSGQVQVTYSNNHAGIRNVTIDPTQIRGLPMNTSNPTTWQWPANFYSMITSPAYANVTEDDANSNSGYVSRGTLLTGNSFGYQTTQHAEGYSAGEIGGTFARTAVGTSYLGRSLGGKYNQSSSLIATGQLWKNPGATGSTDLYLGFFNSNDISKADFIGLYLSGSTGKANIIDSAGGNGATAAGEGSQSISNSTAYQYSMIYTPASGTTAASLLITLANGSNTQTNWSLSGAALSGFSGDFNVDSFGLFSFGDGSAGSMQAYIDDDAVGTSGAVPEPGSLCLLSVAALSLCGRRRQRPACTNA